MRKYTVINSDFGNMPICGYLSDIMETVSGLDGWNILEFACELKKRAEKLEEREEQDGEFFFYINSDFEDDSPFDFGFYSYELALINARDIQDFEFSKTRFFRFFSIDEEYGIEELQFLT